MTTDCSNAESEWSINEYIERFSDLITYQKHNCKLHFAMDAWTSPNHHAFVAVTVHFEHNGEPICLILDVVEVAKVSIIFEIIIK